MPKMEQAQMRALVGILNGIRIIAEADGLPIIPIKRLNFWREFCDAWLEGALGKSAGAHDDIFI